MTISYPHTIENCAGEKLVFLGVENEPDGEKVWGETFVNPGCGPVMHKHLLQDECFTVISGRMGYQVQGQPKQYATAGETVLFKRGVPHRFWNDGQDLLHSKGFVQPAHNVVFFLSSIFAAQNKSGTSKPEMFDASYLLKRYSAEFELTDMPKFVRKVIIPATYFIGKLLGKYKHFKDAPEPVKN